MINKKNAQKQAQETTQNNVSHETSASQLDIKKVVATHPLVTFAAKNGIAVNAARQDFLLHSPNSDGKLSVHIENAEVAAAANVLDSVAHAAKNSVKALCVLLSYVERKGYYAKFGFKTAADFGESFTGLERKTILTYIGVGNTFFDEDMQPIKNFVNDVSVGHLIQIKSIVCDMKYVYGGKTDFGFFQAYFDTCRELDGTIPSVSVLNAFLVGVRKNYIDKRLLCVERKSFFTDSKENRFPEYEELNEVSEGDTAKAAASNSGEPKDGRAAVGTAGKDAASAGGAEPSALDKAITALTDSLHFFTARYADDEELGKMVLALQSHIAEKLHAEEISIESK